MVCCASQILSGAGWLNLAWQVTMADGTLLTAAPGTVVQIGYGLVSTVNLTGVNIYSQDNVAYFSSRGPTADGRFKPEILVSSFCC
jgi:hypothetical protein